MQENSRQKNPNFLHTKILFIKFWVEFLQFVLTNCSLETSTFYCLKIQENSKQKCVNFAHLDYRIQIANLLHKNHVHFTLQVLSTYISYTEKFANFHLHFDLDTILQTFLYTPGSLKNKIPQIFT